MNVEHFKRLQPISYQTLLNSINSQRFAHAYLFYGYEGVELEEYAEFLIQSLLCEAPVSALACGLCNNCQRVAKGLYADIVVLSGEEKTITKKEVLQLMNQLNKTGLEAKGLKFYLIKHVDNATSEALNSLLKFLEEPGNEQTFAVLTTNQIDKVLPTIVSRCLKVAFRPYPKQELLAELSAHQEDASEYYLSARLAGSPGKITDLKDDEVFTRALSIFREHLDFFREDFHQSLVCLETKGMIDRKDNKAFLNYWLALNIQFFKDLNFFDQVPTGWYRDQLLGYKKYQNSSARMLPIFLSAYDQLNGSLNLNLLVEKMYWQLAEVEI